MPLNVASVRRRVRGIVIVLLIPAALIGVTALVLSLTIGMRESSRPPLARDIAIVVSPHPDDETYAMGQSVAAQALAGKKVIGVLVTDGDASRFVEWWAEEHGSDLDADGDVDRWDMGLARRAEYRKAMNELGAEDVVFLGGADSQGATGFEDTKVDSARLEDALEGIARKYPGADWFTTAKWTSGPGRFTHGDFKEHPDHGAVADAVAAVADRTQASAYYFKVYAFFLPRFARFAPVRVEGDAEARERKRAAVEAYEIIGATSTPELFRAAPDDPAEYMVVP